MADCIDMTPERVEEFEAWIASKEKWVQDGLRSKPPWKLYRIVQTGQRVFIISYEENRYKDDKGNLLPPVLECTVGITGEYNKVLFNKQVFGIKFTDLEECDLPGPNEELGTTLTDQKDIEAAIEVIRKNLQVRNLIAKPEERN